MNSRVFRIVSTIIIFVLAFLLGRLDILDLKSVEQNSNDSIFKEKIYRDSIIIDSLEQELDTISIVKDSISLTIDTLKTEISNLKENITYEEYQEKSKTLSDDSISRSNHKLLKQIMESNNIK